MQAFSASLSKKRPCGIDWNAPSPRTLIGTPPATANSDSLPYFTSTGTRRVGYTSFTDGSAASSFSASSVSSRALSGAVAALLRPNRRPPPRPRPPGPNVICPTEPGMTLIESNMPDLVKRPTS